MAPSSVNADLARSAWRRIFDFIVRTAPQRDHVLERLGLTPGDGRTLASLDRHQPRTMRSLAEEWQCDPSNATWMVDRLERRGLVERRTVSEDRRVKHVVLTPAGSEVRAQLLAGLYAPPPELLALDSEDLKLLSEAAARLPIEPATPSNETPGPAGSSSPPRS